MPKCPPDNVGQRGEHSRSVGWVLPASYHKQIGAAAGTRALGCASVTGGTPQGEGVPGKDRNLTQDIPFHGRQVGKVWQQPPWGTGLSLSHYCQVGREVMSGHDARLAGLIQMMTSTPALVFMVTLPHDSRGAAHTQPTQAKPSPDSPSVMVSHKKDLNLSCK